MEISVHRAATALAARLGDIHDHIHQLPLREMQRRALRETCDYIAEKMPTAIGLKSQAECLRYAVRQVGDLPGTFMEFGVHKGVSTRIIGDAVPQRSIHGFDSFEGLPTAWFGNDKGAGHFDTGGKLPKVRPNTTIYKGWFDATLPGWCETHPDKIAFLNIDSDLYSSAAYVLEMLKDRLQVGTVIHFDEYINYPNWKHGEFKAWQEFVDAHRTDYTYLAYSRWGAVVRIDSL